MCSEILLARVCLHREAKGNMKKQTPNHPLLRQLWFLKPIFPRGLSYVYVYSHTIGGKCPKNVSHPSYCATLHLQILTVHRNQRSAYAWERGQNGFSFSGKEEVGERNRRRERERERERGCVGIKTEECSLVGRIRQIVLTIASLMFRVI